MTRKSMLCRCITIAAAAATCLGATVGTVVDAAPQSLRDKFTASMPQDAGTVAVAFTPAGDPARTVTIGGDIDAPAWGTIRVPVALTAARTDTTGTADVVSTAITSSDNTATEQLWSGLGSRQDASRSVTATLRELGDAHTTLPADPGTYSQLGLTRWATADQAKFGAQLLCAQDRGSVTTPMLTSATDSPWGFQTLPTLSREVQAIAVHTGWGPVDNKYVVRQFGLLATPTGLVSMSLAVVPASNTLREGISLAGRVAHWVAANLPNLPRGFCPGTGPMPTSAGSPTTSAAPAGQDTATTTTSAGPAATPTSPSETVRAQATTSATVAPSPNAVAPGATTPTTQATPAAPAPACRKTVIALDPGHNPVEVNPFDPVTGARMVDYPNGAEDADVMSVADMVRRQLEHAGYSVVLVKQRVNESITYRDRVDRAAKAGAVMGVSIHTSPGDHSVFAQRVGLYREGVDARGATTRITFTNQTTARRSQLYAAKFAATRTATEGHQVTVRDNSFDGRPPLWSGNIPIISLIASELPWVYNEFGPATGGGGSTAVAATELAKYAIGIANGVKQSSPASRC